MAAAEDRTGAGNDERRAGTGDWDRLQQEFLSHWFGGAVDPAQLAPWQALTDAFGKAASATASGAPAAGAPWQSFTLFADLLGEQAQQLRAGRKRKVDVATALKAMLESLVRSIDVAIAAQAMLAGDKAMGLASFKFDRAFTAWPALGLSREWQLRMQRCWHALAAEREAGAHLRTLQWRALRAGCERCKRALAAPGPAITSLRGLYDLFVDHVEIAWRETAMTDEYARAFGASTNASLALRAALRDCMQPLAGLLELAGRAEVETIDRRLRDLESRVVTPTAAPAATTPGAEVGPAVKPARVRSGVVKPASPAPAKQASPRRREHGTARATAKTTPRRAEFDIANMIARGDDSE